MRFRQTDVMVAADTEASWELRLSPPGTPALVPSGVSAPPQQPPLLNYPLSLPDLAWLTSPSLNIGERRDVLNEVTKIFHEKQDGGSPLNPIG